MNSYRLEHMFILSSRNTLLRCSYNYHQPFVRVEKETTWFSRSSELGRVKTEKKKESIDPKYIESSSLNSNT